MKQIRFITSNIRRFFNRLSPTRKAITSVLALGVVGFACCLPQELFHAPYSTVVTDRNDLLLGARIAADGQWRFPPRSTTPDKVAQCLIQFEDKHFHHHWGVNPWSIIRAAYQNIEQGRVISGGSTITMQTIRLARNKPRTFREKIIEIIWAIRLEFRASKGEILSMYISHAPFGGNVVGLDAAAWRYFGHAAETLSWAESAMLAVLPNAPSMIHLSKGRSALLAKRNRLLKQLYDTNQIDASTYELAIGEPLPDAPYPLPRTATHLVSRFYQERNGTHTRSTIDRNIQTRIEELAGRWNSELSRSDIRDLAILVIDIRTNEVMGYCGNASGNEAHAGSQVDIIRSSRSTGSILKPFLYYAMLQEGSLLPHTLLPDIPVNINGFTPQNFNPRFEGAVPASEALARSLNIPAVTMLQRYGVPKFHQLLRDAGISTIDRPSSHYGLSLILGGAEATLWDVTGAYVRMGRSLLQLPQSPCRLLLSEVEKEAPSDLFQAGAVWQTFDALKEVNRPEEIDWKSIPSMQTIAWKTGTSYGFRDAWAVGVTPRYAVGVWVGNATGEGKPGLTGAQTAGPILFETFSLLPASPWFDPPQGVFVEAEVCRQSGHLKNRFCEGVDTLLILPEGQRTEACPYHHLILLSADGTQRIYASCAHAEATVRRPWFILPPVWESYYKQYHPEYKLLPAFKAGCGEDAMRPMQFIYPPANARISLPKQLDGSKGFMTAELACNTPNATLFWHLDNTYLTETQHFHQINLQPTSGKHTLTVVDDAGNTVSTTFFIE